jgi:hypothetical protein
MTSLQEDSHRQLRHSVYWLLIVTAVGMMIGRILTVCSALGETPLLSANDRSRWCTIRALVDHGTYVIDDVIFKDPGQTKRDREWYSIDMVRHRGFDGREHYYSSKPPLLATLLAGPYWFVKQTTGATLAERPFYVVRILLILANVVPLAIYFWLLVRLVERYGTTDWGRLYVIAAAVYGTFLSTFVVTLNNHIVAAVSVAAAVYAALPIWRDGERRWRYFAVAGGFAAFAAANELPALSFLGLVGLGLLYRAPARTLLGFVPAVLLVAAAFFGTNYAAHGSWRPPYAHRSNGQLLATVPGEHAGALAAGQIPPAVRQQIADQAELELSDQAAPQPRLSGAGWMIWDPQGEQRLAVTADGDALRVFAWDNWYEYERSYWLSERKTGVDLGEPSRALYAVHVLFGHHGIFSLTPMWLLSLVGLGVWLVRGGDRMRGYASMVLTLSAICLAFYLARPLKDRNYGGVSSGFRWMFWFIPMWLIAILPAADGIAGRRWAKYVALALLLASAVSAGYACLNPWAHPWIYRYWLYMGWAEG